MKTEVSTETKSQINIGGFNGNRSLMPNTIDEAYRIAQAFSRSDFIPKEFKGHPDNCFTAINLGMEIGLPPMRALQSIAVVNGKPTLYGDAQLALVRGSGLLEIFEETYEGVEGSESFTAICKLKRKGDKEETIEKFTIADAKKANLWGKTGPWSTHPKRMMRYKARVFALRDKFADVLLGLTHSVEEMQGEAMIDATPKPRNNEKSFNVADIKKDKATIIEAQYVQQPDCVVTATNAHFEEQKEEVINEQGNEEDKIDAAYERVKTGVKSMKNIKSINMFFDYSSKVDIDYLKEKAPDLYADLLSIKSQCLEVFNDK